jgi:1,4-dihydroxy-2-naphthoate octaprenyltransferase
MPQTFSAWVAAARPRTLPLALSSIGMGSFLAASVGKFDWEICLWCCLTTIFLQILSNLANDYGDSIHGADSKDREGPSRAVQSGLISSRQMLFAIIGCGFLALFSGLLLLNKALAGATQQTFYFFLGLGLLSILAAITYTAGKKPYGYAGLGDVSVIIFFGWVGVMGTYYLYVRQFHPLLLLPATTCGLFAAAVLNINNIRDIESDRKAGKKSVPVRLGRQKAVVYHWLLLVLGMLCAVVYVLLDFHNVFQFLFLVSFPLLFQNGLAIARKNKPSEIDPYLKKMALTTLLFVLSFGIGQLLSF